MNKEQIINRIIEQEIYTGANQMIQHLAQDDTAPFFDQLLDLDTTLDLDEPPEGYTILEREQGYCWVRNEGTTEEWGDAEEHDTPEEAVRAAYDDAEEDPITQEVFQHWLVSDYLAERLEEIGAPIARDVLGLNIWGRTECGQALTMDHHLNQVAALIESHDVA